MQLSYTLQINFRTPSRLFRWNYLLLTGHLQDRMLLDTKISFDTACLVALSAYCRCATNKYFQIIGNIHDIESYFHIIFFSHWGHLAWNGNYELWILNPIATIPIAHGIFEVG